MSKSDHDLDTLQHEATLLLAARGVPISALSVAGATLEIMQKWKMQELLEELLKRRLP